MANHCLSRNQEVRLLLQHNMIHLGKLKPLQPDEQKLKREGMPHRGWASLISQDGILRATTCRRQIPAELPKETLFPLDQGFQGFLSLLVSSMVSISLRDTVHTTHWNKES